MIAGCDYFNWNIIQVRVNLGVMAIKRYAAFSKALALLEPYHQI